MPENASGGDMVYWGDCGNIVMSVYQYREVLIAAAMQDVRDRFKR